MNENSPVWDDHVWTPLLPLEGEITADVCVVGLGGSGLSTIAELLGHGVRVIGLDAGSVAGGAAGRNGGFLLAGTAHFYHDAVRTLGRERARALYRLTLDELECVFSQAPEHVRRVGSLRIAASAEEAADCQEQLDAMTADSFAAEPYDGPEGHGLLFPQDATFQPLARCRTLARSVLKRGAQLFERSPALTLTGNSVTTPQGRVSCSAVIVAVDGRLEILLPELTGRVRTARLQMLATAPTREVRFPHPVYRRYGYEYFQQLPDGRVALGGFRDKGGESEWETSGEPTSEIQERLEQFLREELNVRSPITHRWAAPVGYTRNGLPVLEEVRSKLWAIGGYSGTGNVIGACLGRIAAQLALGLESPGAKLFRT